MCSLRGTTPLHRMYNRRMQRPLHAVRRLYNLGGFSLRHNNHLLHPVLNGYEVGDLEDHNCVGGGA